MFTALSAITFRPFFPLLLFFTPCVAVKKDKSQTHHSLVGVSDGLESERVGKGRIGHLQAGLGQAEEAVGQARHLLEQADLDKLLGVGGVESELSHERAAKVQGQTMFHWLSLGLRPGIGNGQLSKRRLEIELCLDCLHGAEKESDPI